MNTLVLMSLIIGMVVGRMMIILIGITLMKISMLETRSDSQKFVLGIGIAQARKTNIGMGHTLVDPIIHAIRNLFKQIFAIIIILHNYLFGRFLVQMDMSRPLTVHNVDALPVKMM